MEIQSNNMGGSAGGVGKDIVAMAFVR